MFKRMLKICTGINRTTPTSVMDVTLGGGCPVGLRPRLRISASGDDGRLDVNIDRSGVPSAVDDVNLMLPDRW